MFKRNPPTLAGIVLFVLTPLAAYGSATASEYDDLVALSNESREYQEAPISNGVPDHTPAAMRARHAGLWEMTGNSDDVTLVTEDL